MRAVVGGLRACSVLLQVKADAGGSCRRRSLEELRLKSQFSSVVVRDGYAYGLDEGFWRALTWRRASEMEDGTMVLENWCSCMISCWCKRSRARWRCGGEPAEFHEAGRVNALDSKTGTIRGGGDFLLVRNDKEAICFKLACGLRAKLAAAMNTDF